MSKITTLTDEQISLFPAYVDRWTKIGLSTEPANRPEAESGIRRSYELAGLQSPKIVWCSSPLSAGLTRYIVRSTLRAGHGDSVRASVRDSVWASVGDSVGDSVWDSVRASVWASVRASVWDSVWDSVGDSVWDSVGDSVRASCYGQHDADYLSFYNYFEEVLNLKEQTKKLAGLKHQARHGGWWLPHQGICWASERHNILCRDEQGRLHNPDGPALAYPDGFTIYAWHGVRLPEYVITSPEKITVADIGDEDNAEIRRVKIERYGTGRYLLDSGAQIIHEYTGGIRGLVGSKLYHKRIPGDEPIVMVGVVDSTPENGENRVYFLEVPPDIKTCEAAVAWTYGLRPDEYIPMIES